MTNINLEGYEEISQNEYRKFKENDPKNCNGYTARVGFKYFKKKQVFPIEFNTDYHTIRVDDKRTILIEEIEDSYDSVIIEPSELENLKQAIKKAEEIIK